jgi:CheY-like chemotaxis protein
MRLMNVDASAICGASLAWIVSHTDQCCIAISPSQWVKMRAARVRFFTHTSPPRSPGLPHRVGLPQRFAVAAGACYPSNQLRVGLKPARLLNCLRVAILSGLSVLVIDDEADPREMLQQVLSHWGADVVAVASADGARCFLATRTPDVIVSDIAMPDEDGITFVRSLRALSDAVKSNIPAVALSAFSGGNARKQAMASGFNAYLVKPVETWILAQLLRDMAGAPSRSE